MRLGLHELASNDTMTKSRALSSNTTMVPEIGCGFVAVPGLRLLQLKEQAEYDAWLRNG